MTTGIGHQRPDLGGTSEAAVTGSMRSPSRASPTCDQTRLGCRPNARVKRQARQASGRKVNVLNPLERYRKERRLTERPQRRPRTGRHLPGKRVQTKSATPYGVYSSRFNQPELQAENEPKLTGNGLGSESGSFTKHGLATRDHWPAGHLANASRSVICPRATGFRIGLSLT